MIVPFDALPGFSLDAVRREIGAYYGVAPKVFRKIEEPPTSNLVAEARDAFAWKLLRHHGASAERMAPFCGCEPETLRAGAAAHAARQHAWRVANRVTAA